MKSARYKSSTIARLTGLSPILLRTWERRHGLLRPDRTEGGHRLYTPDDLRLLRRIQVLLRRGMSIGEVEALGREALLAGPRRDDRAPDAGTPRDAATTSVAAWRDDLVEAAVELDAPRAGRALDEAFAAVSPERALELVVEPALSTIGELWGRERCSVAGEHLVSELISGRLHALFRAAAGAGRSPPRAVCACLPDEYHTLGGLTLALLLSRQGLPVTWLGPSLPLADLDRACEELAPELVLLSVSRAALLELHGPGLSELARRRPGVRFVVGGAGCGAAPPAGLELLAGSAHALDLDALRRRARPARRKAAAPAPRGR